MRCSYAGRGWRAGKLQATERRACGTCAAPCWYGLQASTQPAACCTLVRPCSEQLAEQSESVPSVDNLEFVMESLALGHTVLDQKTVRAAANPASSTD